MRSAPTFSWQWGEPTQAFSIEAALLNSMGPPDNLILPESHEPANDLAKFDSLWFAW
jgi:hypothetical protein